MTSYKNFILDFGLRIHNAPCTKFEQDQANILANVPCPLSSKTVLSQFWTSMHAPLRQHKVRNTYAPYIDHELRHKMFLRDFHKKQFNKTKSPDTWKQFQQLRNKINIERQKKEY